MKKVRLLLVAGIISCWIQGVSAQTDTTITENFDGNTVSWTSSPVSAWKIDTNCSLSPPNALRGIVPNMPGDSVIFTTQTYDLTGHSYALLRFSHICKVSPNDKVRIEYRISQQGWEVIPVESYKGNAKNFQLQGFNAASYTEWDAGDSLTMPTQLWWKEETFDVGFEVAGDHGVQFRFIIERGNTTGTQISYGWLLDNIEVIMAPYSLALPIVEFVEPFIKDSVPSGGPWTINAKVKTQTYAPIETPWLKYTATREGVILGEDSILMTRVKGDSLWKATIPSFMLGTKVVYSVTGRDATGNYAGDESNYVVSRPGSGNVEIGNKANASYEYPMNTGYSYSWSKQLYYGTEVTPQAQGGFITKLAWNIYNGDPFGWDYENQKCYMRAVDDVLIPNNVYVDPVAEGATLVWSNSYGTAANVTGWVEITLDQSFRLTPGKNLLIYWIHQNGDYTWGYPSFANSITAANTVAYGFSDNSFAEATSAAYSSVTNRRADARFYIDRIYIPNSASVSINIEEQIAVSASSRIPVIAVIKNYGLSDLGTVDVSYSVNGSTPVTKTVTINPALVWGTAIEDTLGYYTPKVEGYDTIAVWVKMPNGQADQTVWDDTAKQIVYGCTDLQISFVKYPEDILYYQDPVEIMAEITSFSRAQLPDSVSLFLTIENKGITKYDTLDMVNLSGNLWTATIPAQAYGSTVHYAIKLTDILGNEATASKEYFIEKIVCTSGDGEYFAIQDQSITTSPSYPLYLMSYGYSRSMSLYTAEEISDKAIGLINKIALRVSTAGRGGTFPMKVWLKTVPATKTAWINSTAEDNKDWDTLTKDATLVYDGDFNFDRTGWVDIPLSIPFLYMDTHNLVVMFEQNCGGYYCYDATTTPNFYYSTTATGKYWNKAGSTPPTASSSLSISASRPDLRVEIFPLCPDSNSVALVSIDSPLSEGVTFGSSLPINVTIGNKGEYNLNSCIINWSKNGVLQTPYNYSGNLLKDSTQTVTIGNYTPVEAVWDTIVVWVSMPNGVQDVLTSDDKLDIHTIGCFTGALSGTKTVGAGGNFPSINIAMDNISYCGGLTGDLTLQLKGTFSEYIDMTKINPYLNGYHLTITSLDNHADSAIVKPDTVKGGICFELKNIDNITFKNITIDATAANATYGLQMRDSCNNISVENCNLLATLTTTSSKAPVYIPNIVGNNIVFRNNLFDGGYYGIYISGQASHVTFDSNTITNSHQYGIQASLPYFDDFSYNTVTNRLSGGSSSWNGVYLTGCSGPFIRGNRIIQISPVLSSPTGMYVANFNDYNTTDTGLMINNEIILNMSGAYNGINATGGRLRIMHNSIYIAGTAGAARGIYIVNSNNSMLIKNNNIVMRSPAAHPLYFYVANTAQLYDMDYNNLYASANIGYYNSAAITSQAIWQQTFVTDQHSVKILPDYIDSAEHLKLQNYDNLICPKNTLVTVDIENTVRTEGTVTMGCYQGIMPHQADVILTEVTGNGVVVTLGSIDSIQVTLLNAGLTTVSKMTLKWKLNNQQQPDVMWTGTFASESRIVIPLGGLTYNTTGNYTITVWVENLDQLTDQDHTNDTAYAQGYVCPGLLNGTYQVGNNNATFLSIPDFISIATLCGVGGDITLALQPGNYDPIDLTNINALTGNHSLTITSSTGAASDVTITAAGKPCITLSKSNNITIKDITLSATANTANTHGILFPTDPCNNIAVIGCTINLGLTVTAVNNGTGIYKANATGRVLNGFTMKHCTVNGGYAGINLVGAAVNTSRNIIVDSNTFTNQSNSPIMLTYINTYSVSYNRGTPRSTSAAVNWYGMNASALNNGKIIGNRVLVPTAVTGITTGLHGIYLSYARYSQVINNEIYLSSYATQTNGLYLSTSQATQVINNTIYVNKTGGATSGSTYSPAYCTALYSNIEEGCHVVIKNNIFYASHASSLSGAAAMTYALYFGSSSTSATVVQQAFDNFKSNFEMNYNNYFSTGTNLIYARATNLVNLAAWKAIMPNDQHSEDIQPAFVNVASGLQLSNHAAFATPKSDIALFDIENSPRSGGTTVKGCYHSIPSLTVNASLIELTNYQELLANGITDTVKVTLFNTGSTPIKDATIKWEWNNSVQANVVWTGVLATGNSVVISLGKMVNSAAGSYSVKAWIDNLGGLTDGYPDDDTVFMEIYKCAAPFNGVYTIGNTGANFTTVNDFLNKAALCGVNGDVTLEIQNGTYNQSIDLSNTTSLLGNNTLTITSAAHDAEKVILKTNLVGVTLYNSNNIVLKDLTIDAREGNYAVRFINGCTNVVIRECRLLADTINNKINYTLASVTTAPIYKGIATGGDMTFIAKNISIINNLLDGGYTGFHFYGGTGYAAGTFATDIIFDSNIVSNQLCQGTYIYYTHFSSFSNNTFLSRTTNTDLFWRGPGILYSVVDVMENNRVRQRSNAIVASVGLYFYYLNYPNMFTPSTSAYNPLIANNEIILNVEGTTQVGGNTTTHTGMGIYGYYSRLDMIHNSIYVSGSGVARGIYLEGSATYSFTKIINSNIVMTSNTAYPIYVNQAVVVTPAQATINYNNLYSPSYIGYVAGTGDIQSISAWQTAVTTDKHSDRVAVSFADPSVSLELLDASGLNCPYYSGVGYDINGSVRLNTTTMGAYNNIKAALDLKIEKITNAADTIVVYPQPVPLKILVENAGISSKVDSAIFGWSINGVQQPFYTWQPSNPLQPKSKEEVTVGLIHPGNISNLNIVVWLENVNGRKDSATVNDTAKAFIQVFCAGSNLAVQSIGQLVPDGLKCIDDNTSLNTVIGNTGTTDYDFSANPLKIFVEVTQPAPYYLDTLISSGILQSGADMPIQLTDTFPIFRAGRYDIKIWLDSSSTIIYDDTLLTEYVSGRFGLPIDEDFSDGMPDIFIVEERNTSHTWEILSKGTDADSVIVPQFGSGMIAFKGSPGSMATLFTQQLDLSRSDEPSLSFWYFHDTIPCEDYMDVRITIDGRITYTTLLSLIKYNTVYGWKQYNVDLPPFATDQCVRLAFEAMEKSRNGNVTQYIDRIRITAKQDIAITEILISDYDVCNLENKELKAVLTNLTDPSLNFATTSTIVTLEVKETGEIFTDTLITGSLGSFASDTITLAKGFDLEKGTYTFKAYFSSVLDVDRDNDTLETNISINPEISLDIIEITGGGNINCLSGESDVFQSVVITNTGNMDLSDIALILQIDTGTSGTPAYTVIKETCPNTILVGENYTYTFDNSYKAPWQIDYYPRVYAYLSCDTALVNATTATIECVDTKDLDLVNIDNPSASVNDNVGSSVQVKVTIRNRSSQDYFNSADITVVVTNSQGVQTAKITETTGAIGISATVNHTFTDSYTVPNDTVYYLTVYIESCENYPQNDTLVIKRITDYTDINAIESAVFTLGQNIPNPANNSTRIDYSVPEAGEVVFHVHSISGQLLYSKTIDTKRGTNSIKLNTSTFAAGVYFYSMEYKGQKRMKQLIISN